MKKEGKKKKRLPEERETNRPFITTSLQRFMAFHACREESLGTLEEGSTVNHGAGLELSCSLKIDVCPQPTDGLLRWTPERCAGWALNEKVLLFPLC